jgi:hypothetical protein
MRLQVSVRLGVGLFFYICGIKSYLKKMKKICAPLFLVLLIAVFSACKKDKSVIPAVVNKAVGKWNADKGINAYYDKNGTLTLSDTIILHNSYVFDLNADGTGDVLVSGKNDLTFKYSISNSKINYSGVVYYNPDGTKAGDEADYFETITNSTDTSLVTVLEQISPDGSGDKSLTTIYFTKVK